MAPLLDALIVNCVEIESAAKASVWKGCIDHVWTVGFVAHGGYTLGLIIEACIAHQRANASELTNPVHVSTHFLRPVLVDASSQTSDESENGGSGPQTPFKIHVKTVKEGSKISNVSAEFIHKGRTAISSHIIFSLSSPADHFKKPDPSGSPVSSELVALIHPCPFARSAPFRTHPKDCPPHWFYDLWNFKDYIEARDDPVFDSLNHVLARQIMDVTDSENESHLVRDPPGVDFGGWLTVKGKEGIVRPSMLAFCADIVKPLPELLPSEINPLQGKAFYATLTMTLEFKAPLELICGTEYSKDTVGLYTLGRFMQEPLGRHDTYQEVWTCPSDHAEGKHDGRWREKQHCLAVATQTAITIPFEELSTKSKL